jgi:hypothetical protein
LPFADASKRVTKQEQLSGGVLPAALVFAGLAFAQKPAANVDAKRHPNLVAAQQHSRNNIALRRIRIPSKHNPSTRMSSEDAEKSIGLLVRADQELKQAAE